MATSFLARNRVAMILAITSIVVFGGVFGFIAIKNMFIKNYLADYKPPPVTVATYKAELVGWHAQLQAVGTVRAEQGVDVSSEVAGIVRELRFASGQQVKQGDVLLRLDDAVEQADLQAFSAQLELARLNNARDRKLIAQKAISKTDFDAGEARLKELEAQVQRTRALIEQKQVRAPFSGRLGIRMVDVGQFVDRGNVLVTLQALDVVNVDFHVPEQYLPRLFPGQVVSFTVQAWGEQKFTGKISAINAKVDPATRNVQVRATLQNSGERLLPGMFANLSVDIGDSQKRIVVPDSAVSPSLYGDTIYVVTPGPSEKLSKVERRYVKVGERRGGMVELLSGVKAGEDVVAAGHIKIDNGAEVVIDNSVQLVKP